jgi:thiamine pyrophosphate-dependent acetolactate synthase large subunit-like protein
MDGGQLIAQSIAAQGVRFAFTLCGGHISPILSGFKAHGVRVVDVRHEANAVFAADAVARLTGIPGVAAVTAGPGLTNTITAVKNAAMAQSPLVLLGGSAPTVLKGRGALQDIDQMALMQPLVKWMGSVKRIKHIPKLVAEAFRQARSGVPGPVFLECPIDVLYPQSLVREWYGDAGGKNPKSIGQKLLKRYLNWHLDRMFHQAEATQAAAPIGAVPYPGHTGAELKRVRKALEAAQRPLLLVGSQCLLDAPSAEGLADALRHLGIPVYLSGMARGLLGAQDPLLLRHKRRNALKEADLVLLAGVPSDFRLDYGNHVRRSSTLVGINRSRADLNLNRRPNIGVLGDPGDFLRALAAETPEGPLGGASSGDRSADPAAYTRAAWSNWLLQLRARDADREANINEQAQQADIPHPEGGAAGINPVRLFRELNPLLPENSILVADGGDFVGTAAYTLHARGPLTWLDPGAFGTLGVGGGFALGAKCCRPDAEVWIVWGDGSSAYSLAEFDTFARHGLPVIGLVGNDACWAQIARDQVEILKDDVAVMLSHSDYDRVAQGYGGSGSRVDSLDAFLAAVPEAQRAAREGRPYLLNAIIGKTDFRKGSISM